MSSKEKIKITHHGLQKKIKANAEVKKISSELMNMSSKCKIIWKLFMYLNQYIDTFEIESEGNQIVYEQLLKESSMLYKKNIECGENMDQLEYELEDIIDEIADKYQIVHNTVPIMNISRHARGKKRRNTKRKKLNKK